MRLSPSRMVLAVISALLSYIFLLYLLPRVLSLLGFGSNPNTILPQESIYVAVGIVALEAVSALFSTTRIRGVFMVGLGLLAYLFIVSAFSSGIIATHTPTYLVSVNIGFVVAIMKILALLEAARGCVTLMADNT